MKKIGVIKYDNMTISIIAALSSNNVIGTENSLPWEIPADLKHFQKITLGKPVIMGQKTFESIKNPLPGRKNIVLTFDKDFKPEGCVVAYSIDEAIQKAEKEKEIMIIGGASIYEQFLPLADKMYLTLIHRDFKGDSFFPEFDRSEWLEIEREKNESDGYEYDFVIFQKKVT